MLLTDAAEQRTRPGLVSPHPRSILEDRLHPPRRVVLELGNDVTVGVHRPPQLEPVLDDRVFEHILGVIRRQGQQMEQSPGTYAGMGDEDRRHTLVATLNTHYAGRAHAEAFNNQGKTDVLIRHEGRDRFICECKFWSGIEGFRDTIDQLFRTPVGETRSWRS